MRSLRHDFPFPEHSPHQDWKDTRKTEAKLQTAQAVTDTKIEELTREVREHNNFARRMPVVENEIRHIETTVAKLESYHNN